MSLMVGQKFNAGYSHQKSSNYMAFKGGNVAKVNTNSKPVTHVTVNHLVSSVKGMTQPLAEAFSLFAKKLASVGTRQPKI